MGQRGVVPNGVPLTIALIFAVVVLGGLFTGGATFIALIPLMWIGSIILTVFLITLAVRAVNALESIAQSLQSERSDVDPQ